MGSVRVPGCQNYKWRLNPVWHRMLYNCSHMATVGVKKQSNERLCLHVEWTQLARSAEYKPQPFRSSSVITPMYSYSSSLQFQVLKWAYSRFPAYSVKARNSSFNTRYSSSFLILETRYASEHNTACVTWQSAWRNRAVGAEEKVAVTKDKSFRPIHFACINEV